MLIYRVQLPEDAESSQAAAAATPASNSLTVAPAPNTGTTGSETTPQNSETTAPETQLPAAGGSTGATGPTIPPSLRSLLDYMWNDPHTRICEL